MVLLEFGLAIYGFCKSNLDSVLHCTVILESKHGRSESSARGNEWIRGTCFWLQLFCFRLCDVGVDSAGWSSLSAESLDALPCLLCIFIVVFYLTLNSSPRILDPQQRSRLLDIRFISAIPSARHFVLLLSIKDY